MSLASKMQAEEDIKPYNACFNPGYHLIEIPKGKYGEISKIEEELLELKDAISQGNKLMALVELADMIGAIEGYLEKEYGDKITLNDLLKMAKVTRRAFESGCRQ